MSNNEDAIDESGEAEITQQQKREQRKRESCTHDVWDNGKCRSCGYLYSDTEELLLHSEQQQPEQQEGQESKPLNCHVHMLAYQDGVCVLCEQEGREPGSVDKWYKLYQVEAKKLRDMIEEMEIEGTLRKNKALNTKRITISRKCAGDAQADIEYIYRSDPEFKGFDVKYNPNWKELEAALKGEQQ